MNQLVHLFHRIRAAALPLAFAMPVVRLLGFVIVTAYALRTLNPGDMGLWYVLQQIASLSAAIELGFGATVGRHASYYAAGSEEVPTFGLAAKLTANSSPRFDLLAGLVSACRRLYSYFGAASVILALVAGGLWLTHGEASMLQTRSQFAAYVLMAFGAGFNLFGLYWLAILLGINQPRNYYAFMIVGLLVNYSIALLGLWSGLGVAALASGYVIWNIVPRVLARHKILRTIPASTWAHVKRARLATIWPITWRGGLATLSSSFTIPITTVICARVADLDTAGSYGLCMQIALLIHVLAASWQSVKLPLIAQWQAQHRFSDIRRLCRQRMALSLLTYAAAAAAIIALGPWVLSLIGSRTPPLPTAQWIALMFVVGLDLWVGLHSAALLTENRVPHLAPFVVSALISAPLAWFLGRLWGVWGLLAAPAIAQITWSYWWTPMLFWRRVSRKRELENA